MRILIKLWAIIIKNNSYKVLSEISLRSNKKKCKYFLIISFIFENFKIIIKNKSLLENINKR